jgi:MFS family permease
MGSETMRDKALRVVWTLTACTALALLGDATLYAVLPTSYAAVGVTAMQVGWLLSINRLARIPINLLSGSMCRRWGARWPYIIGVGVGALSTAGYALAQGFWPLLALRALWGVSWALLVVAANTLVLQVSTAANRGRNSGIYTPYSFFGGALGAVLGGVLVDRLGFQPAMGILGALTAVGCLLALTLPHIPAPERDEPLPSVAVRPNWASLGDTLRGTDARVLLAMVTILLHRLFFAGVFYATFGYFLKWRFPQGIGLGAWLLGGATLTSVLLWAKDLVTVSAGPALGHLSDRLNDRPLVLVLGLGAGVAGLLTLAATRGPGPLLLGVALVAIAYGIVPPILISWLGDLTPPHERSGILGVFQAVGDLGSGLGPLFAYRLVQIVDIGVVYVVCALLLALLAPFILRSRRAHAGVRPSY